VNTELDIVRRRLFSYLSRIVSALCIAVVTGAGPWQGKDASEIATWAIVLVIVGAIGQAAVASSAWFSTAAGDAKEEIKNGDPK